METSKKLIKLFEETISGYTLTTNSVDKERLCVWDIKEDDQEQYINKIKTFYQAIGCMMAHCILLSKDNYGPKLFWESKFFVRFFYVFVYFLVLMV